MLTRIVSKSAPYSGRKAAHTALASLIFFAALFLNFYAQAILPPVQPTIPDLDTRLAPGGSQSNVTDEQRDEAASLKEEFPAVRIAFDSITGSPRSISAGSHFLTGPDGTGQGILPRLIPLADTNRAVKAFLLAHQRLFGFGPEALDKARVKRSFEGNRNGLLTMVWEQQLEEIPIFEAVFISHTTKRGELVSLSSQFMRDPDSAATNSGQTAAVPALPPAKAVAAATASIGEPIHSEDIHALPCYPGAQTNDDPERHHRLECKGIKGVADAKLIWLPMDKDKLRLCWDVVFTSRKRGEMFRVLVDARTGGVLVRRCLTEYISDATYRVFTAGSPAPMLPGLDVPGTNQAPYVPSELVTISALDTNASPNGWIDDGVTETLGNNVDGHTDFDADDLPDLPRPDGGTNRLFDFTMDLSVDDPTNYSAASVVNAFYWCNWMHDKLYDMGFTEAAGNFQTTNFGRGGFEGDPVLTDCQDGGGFNNANFSAPLDGMPGRMQLYLFPGPTPSRDGSLEASVILHEYTHGLSNRRVGGGALIGALQSKGMGEGWSDFFALSLLSHPEDDPNANYPMAAYLGYQLLGILDQNYYFGVRRYPYTTDISKDPLTFKDIDPTQADSHSGVPLNPVFSGDATEIHNQGEVWCVTLWDARANLINKYGTEAGNALMLQLVMDGMNLTPPNPNFLEARDGILQADLVDNGGANQHELWLAFAKRGMGLSATAPDSSTTTGVVEAYDWPDDFQIDPKIGFIASGPAGGPFAPNFTAITLTNIGTNTLAWGLSITSAWLNASAPDGFIPPGTNDTINIAVDDSATNLPAGIYTASILFTNSSSTNIEACSFVLRVDQPDYFTELFDSSDNDLAFRKFTFTPDGGTSFYSVCQEPAHAFPTDPAGGTPLFLIDDDSAQITLSGTNTVRIYGTQTNVIFVGSNGYLTMNQGDINYLESLAAHFDLPRVSVFFHDLDPEVGGSISWKELPDRLAVTYENITQYNSPLGNSFEVEMFFDGRIRLTYLEINCLKNLVGLSAGNGVPPWFLESDLSENAFCPPEPPVFLAQPDSQFLESGTNAAISALVSGAEPLFFQWQRDGTNLFNAGRISGATSSSLNIANARGTDSGDYTLIVTNEYAFITSAVATLTVTGAVDHFVWSHIPAPQSAGVPFTVGIEARDSSDILSSNFNGSVLLATTNGIPVFPAISDNFSNGVWIGSITLGTADTNIELVADDGAGRSGVTDISVVAAPLLALQTFTNNAYLVWTAGAPLLKLETTTNLDSGPWIEIPAPPQVGDQYLLPFLRDEPVRFYRLRFGDQPGL